MSSSFTKNSLITIASQIPIFIFGLGGSIIISRLLGAEGRGIYTLALLFPAFLVALFNLGLGSSTVYYIGQKKYPVREVLGNDILLTLWLTLGSFLISLAIIAFFRRELFPGVPAEYLFWSLLLIPGQLFLGIVFYILLGREKFYQYNFILVIRAFLSFSLVGIFIWGLGYGVKAAILTEAVSFLVTAGILVFLLFREAGGISWKINREFLRDSLDYGVKTHIGNVFYFIYRRLNFILVNIYLSPAMLGFYSLSIGLTERIWLISDAVGTVLFPRISAEKDEKRLKEFTPAVFRNVIFIILGISIFFYLVAYWLIVFLYSEEFAESVGPFRILLPGIIAYSGWRILENDIRGRGKPMLNTYVTAFSVILNLALNLLWIPRFGIAGAAWATTVSYTATLLTGMIVFCRISGNRLRDLLIPRKVDILLWKNIFLGMINSSFSRQRESSKIK